MYEKHDANPKTVMKILKFFCTLFLLTLSFGGWSQDSLFQKLYEIPIKARFFTTDKLQQLYIVTSDNTIIKCTPDNYQEQYRFSNNTLGELDYIDATDPFNLLLYYPDYQVIVTLDRTLNQTGKFSLNEVGVVQARTVGMSNDGNIWVYDEASFQLRKLSRSGEVLFESQNLSLIFPKKAPQPIQIVARENWVYLNDPAQGILVFNNFGQYNNMIAFEKISRFQIVDNLLVFKEKNILKIYNFKSFLFNKMPLPTGVEENDVIQIQQNRLFVLKADKIEIYSWK